ncbi:MAG: DUF4835 family protein [Flavobacteriaceae bacterium]
MNRLLCITFFLFYGLNLLSQDVNANVIVNSNQINQTNKSVFKNFEKSIKSLVSSRSWSNNTLSNNEKLNINILINVISYSNNFFTANFEFQSLRPVLNSTYQTPVFNFVDNNVEFKFEEFETLYFIENQFNSEIVSLISFYINIILGMDNDSFIKNSGNKYYNKAQEILNLANQSSSSNSWQSTSNGGRINKFWLVENLNSSNSKEFRDLLYTYHVNGLDLMHENILKSKENISNSIISLQKMNRRTPNSLLIKVFFDTKSDEIKDVFSSGPKINTDNLSQQLNRLAPFFSAKWRNIR